MFSLGGAGGVCMTSQGGVGAAGLRLFYIFLNTFPHLITVLGGNGGDAGTKGPGGPGTYTQKKKISISTI
jgi:hypothetical protein